MTTVRFRSSRSALARCFRVSSSLFFGLLLLLVFLPTTIHAQGCSNTCPPDNQGTLEEDALCEGDSVDGSTLPNFNKMYDICFGGQDAINGAPTTTASISLQSLVQDQGLVVVLSFLIILCVNGLGLGLSI